MARVRLILGVIGLILINSVTATAGMQMSELPLAIIVNDSRAQYTTMLQQAELPGSDVEIDSFDSSVSISSDGKNVVVESPATNVGINANQGVAYVHGTIGLLDYIGLSPSSATINAGGTQTYTSTASDSFNNSLGDVTGSTTFSISPNGSCIGATCMATISGPHIATAKYQEITAKANLFVNESPLYMWHTFYGSKSDQYYDGYNVMGESITVDNSGNVYVVGTSYGPWYGPSGQYPLHPFSSSGIAPPGIPDIFVLKLDSSGTYQWHTFYGAFNNADYSGSITVDGSGNVYVAGWSYADWNEPSNHLLQPPPLNPHNGGPNVFVLKLDSSGTYQWRTFYGTKIYGPGEGVGVAVDSSSNVYVAATTTGNWYGPLQAAPLNIYGAGNYDIVVLKLNSSGAYQWHTFYGSDSQVKGMNIDSSGNVYVTGWSTKMWWGPSVQLDNPLHTHSGGTNIFILKLTSSGAYQWHTFYGSGHGDTGTEIAIDSNGNVYVSGYGNAGWDSPSWQYPPLNEYNGNCNIVVLKLNSSGAYQWHTFYGGSGAGSSGDGIEIDSNGNIYVTGDSSASWNGPLLQPPLNFFSDTATSMFMLKLNSSGAYQWHTFYGSDTFGRGIAIDNSVNVYVTGWAGTTWNGPSSQSPINLLIDPAINIFILKMSDFIVPGAPTGVIATAGNAQATVSFTAPTSNGGSPITSYMVTSIPGGITATGTSSPITVSGLTNGTTYTFTVIATNAFGNGLASAPSNSVTPIFFVDHIVINPLTVTISAGGSQTYITTAYDASNNSLGDVTSSTTFSISPDGSCTGATCTVTVPGSHTVIGNYSGKTATASLQVNAVSFILTVASSNPNSGVYIVESPPDKNGYIDGVTQFTRSYDHGTAVTLYAPSTAGGNNFSSWSGCDSASGVTCNVTTNSDRTVTAIYVAPPLDHIVLSPSSATISAGVIQVYTATGYDAFNNSLGDVTGSTTFTISPDGSCTGATCTATVPGSHTVIGNYSGKTATASLQVNPGAATITLDLFSPEYSSCGNLSINGYVGTSNGTITRLSWDWGDDVVAESFFPAAHHYLENGSYTVTVTAFCSTGETQSASSAVSIINAKDPQCNTPETYNFKKYLIDAPDNPFNGWVQSMNAATGEVTINACCTGPLLTPYTFEWGDGTILDGWLPQSHIYENKTKNYIVTVTAHYNDGTTDRARTVVRFTSPKITPILLSADIAVTIPDHMVDLQTRLYSLSPNLTYFDDSFFTTIPRAIIEYVLTLAASIQKDFVNDNVFLFNNKFEQVMLRDPLFQGMGSLWFTNPASFVSGDLGVQTIPIQWSPFMHEMGHNFTANTPSDYYYGGKIDGNANAIFGESLGRIFMIATPYEILNNYNYFGLSEDLAEDIYQNAVQYMRDDIRWHYKDYLNTGMPFFSWNDQGTQLDETFGTFATIAYKFIEHAENDGLGYKIPLKRMLTLLQTFDQDIAIRYDPAHDTPSADTFRSTWMVTALSYAFSKDLREEFRSLNFPIDDQLYSEFYQRAQEDMQYTLTLTKTGTGDGNVTANTGTINWSGNSGTAIYDRNTLVILTATASSGSTISSWSGCDSSNANQCTVTMNAAKNVTATFTLNSALPHLDLGSASGAMGSTVTIPITLTNISGTSISAIGMDIGYDAGILENPTCTVGPAGSAAGKSCATSTPSSGIFRIGGVGLNSTAIGDGIVENITFTIKTTAALGITQLTNTPSASGPAGNALSVSGSNGFVTIISKAADCNGDNTVSIAEVQSAINMYLGLKAVAGCVDANGDSKVTIDEAQKGINCYLGSC